MIGTSTIVKFSPFTNRQLFLILMYSMSTSKNVLAEFSDIQQIEVILNDLKTKEVLSSLTLDREKKIKCSLFYLVHVNIWF